MNYVLEKYAVRQVIDHVFEFDDAQKAFEHVQSAKHMGKIVVRI